MKPFPTGKLWICRLLLPLIIFYCIDAYGQATPAYWDLLDVKTAKNTDKLYEIDFYRSPSTIFGHVDSVKFVELMGAAKPKVSVKWPIASYDLNPEEVRRQLGAELRIFDANLKTVSDSVLWEAWVQKDYNPLVEARHNLLVPIDTSTKNRSKPADTALTRKVVVLGARVDSLKDSVKQINRRVDSLNTVKQSGATTSVSGPNAPAPVAASQPATPAPAQSGKDTAHTPVMDSTAYKAILAKYDSVIATLKKKTDTLDNDSTNDHLTLLNAFNFDFTGKLTSSYLGVFNVFAPNIDSTRWGFIGGIEKINYSNGNINGNDTGQFIYAQVNTLQNPLDYYEPTDTVRAGASYVRQFNKYTFSNANTVWSFYIQPLFKLGDPTKKTGVYLHLHGELLVNEYTRTTTIQTISTDTLTVATNQTSGNDYNRVANNPIVSNFNFISGYFGAGATFYLKPFKKAHTHFFFQPTLGLAINAPQLSALGGTSIPAQNGSYLYYFVYSKPKAFYLVRASYIQTLSTKAELIIGTSFRGILPNEPPQYAAYLGINLDLNSLVKLITGG